MHFTTFVSVVSVSASFLALTNAAPLNIARSEKHCPAGTEYKAVGQCTSGFIGCLAEENMNYGCYGRKRFNWGDCAAPVEEGSPYAPAYLGQFYNCANGFVGCTTNSLVCDSKPATIPTPPVVTPPVTPAVTPAEPEVPTPVEPTRGKCLPGLWYAQPNECSSGFVGCAKDVKICEGPKRYWGTCPCNTGTYLVCNGFVGCTTEAICELKTPFTY